MSTKKHKGTISIIRWNSNKPPHEGIGIEIRDEVSGTLVIDLDMTPEAFGNAVTGASGQDVEFDLWHRCVGMKQEQKTEQVKCDRYFKSEEEKKPFLEPLETDGWKARYSDLGNHHRYSSKDGTYSVSFSRYVNPETGEPVL